MLWPFLNSLPRKIHKFSNGPVRYHESQNAIRVHSYFVFTLLWGHNLVKEVIIMVENGIFSLATVLIISLKNNRSALVNFLISFYNQTTK